jgi:hypothetical protein
LNIFLQTDSYLNAFIEDKITKIHKVVRVMRLIDKKNYKNVTLIQKSLLPLLLYLRTPQTVQCHNAIQQTNALCQAKETHTSPIN